MGMAPKPGPRPDADEAIALMRQARARGRGRRSPIMVWMQQNRVALETAFAQTAPAWSVLASYLGERGVTDGDGKSPTARATREAWARVKAARKATPAPEPAAPEPGPVKHLAPPADDDPAQPPPKGERFKMASLRGHTPPAPQPEPAVPPAPGPRQDPDRVIADLLARAPKGSGFRKPEPKDE
jgi:hypothetical protein